MSTPEGNSSASVEPVSTSPVENTQASSDNPAWGSWVSELPTEFQSRVKPHLQEWDKSYQELSQKYAPFKDYTPEKVTEYHNLYTSIEKDPVAFYSRLQEALRNGNMLPAEAQAAVQAIETQQSNDPAEEEEDPRIKKLQDQLDALQQPVQQQQQWLAEQANNRQIEEFGRQIDGDIQKLRATHGSFDELEVLRRAEANLQMGRPFGVDVAFKEMQEYNQKILSQPRPGAGAPRVLNPNSAGGVPPTNSVDRPKTTEDRAAYLAARLRAASE